MGGVTKLDGNFVSEAKLEQAYTAHGVNEAVGYQVMPLALMLVGVMVLCTLYLKERV